MSDTSIVHFPGQNAMPDQVSKWNIHMVAKAAKMEGVTDILFNRPLSQNIPLSPKLMQSLDGYDETNDRERIYILKIKQDNIDRADLNARNQLIASRNIQEVSTKAFHLIHDSVVLSGDTSWGTYLATRCGDNPVAELVQHYDGHVAWLETQTYLHATDPRIVEKHFEAKDAALISFTSSNVTTDSFSKQVSHFVTDINPHLPRPHVGDQIGSRILEWMPESAIMATHALRERLQKKRGTAAGTSLLSDHVVVLQECVKLIGVLFPGNSKHYQMPKQPDPPLMASVPNDESTSGGKGENELLAQLLSIVGGEKKLKGKGWEALSALFKKGKLKKPTVIITIKELKAGVYCGFCPHVNKDGQKSSCASNPSFAGPIDKFLAENPARLARVFARRDANAVMLGMA